MFFCGKVKAQENFSGGQGSNLIVKTGVLVVEKEDLEIKLHAGFAEVKQVYLFKNEKNSAQDTSFSFPYQLGAKNTGLDNINISIDGLPIQYASSKELNGLNFTYFKLFQTSFAPGQTKKIQISHWQSNGASLRGLRSFSYNLKNKLPEPIGEFNLTIYLMDSLNIEQFSKNSNPDLDIKLEPFGWKNQDSTLSWQWQNISPGFDILANFYWPNGDLARISQLNKNIGLYEVKTSTNPTYAFNLVDSSYLTSWEVINFSPTNQPKIGIDFPRLTDIEEFRIIPGKADSIENFLNYARPKELLLTFDDNQTETVILSDSLKMQTIKLTKSVDAGSVQITIKSIYPGKINPATVVISEIEFGLSPTEIVNNTQTQLEDKTIWQRLFIQPSKNIVSFFSNIFKGEV